MDGHLLSPGWAPTILRMVTQRKEVYYIDGFWHLYLTHKTNNRCQLLWMVTNHPFDCHSPTQGCSPTKRKCTEDMEFGA